MSEAPGFCEKCGAPLEPGVRLCEECGQAASEAPAQQAARLAQAQGREAGARPPSPAARPGRRMARGGAVVAAGALGVLLILLLSCGEAEDDIPASGSDVSAAGVTLRLPEGWAFLDNGERGLVLASREDDLSAAAPQGPRLTAGPGDMALPDPEELVDALLPAGTEAEAAGTGVEVVEEPVVVSVGTEEGVSIGLREEQEGTTLVRRYVIINVGGTRVYQFVLEAPADEWETSVDTLEGILESAKF